MPTPRQFSDALLLDLGQKIRPLVQLSKNDVPRYGMGEIELATPFNLEAGNLVRGLVAIGSFEPLLAPHKPYNPGIIQATVEEILSQAPDGFLKQGSAFVLRPVSGPLGVKNLGEHHLVTATFFKGELPESVRSQPVTLARAALNR